jgi:nucleotide-binding universal stress UspA family protein
VAKKPINHILILVDGTNSSSRAADYAIELARTVSARVTGLAVVDTDTLRQLLNVHFLVESEMMEFEQELGQSCQNHLHDVRQRAMDRRVKFDDVLRSGNSEVVVPIEVSQRQVDLLIMGAFRSERIKYDLIARQRQQILDRVPCPVLVVK